MLKNESGEKHHFNKLITMETICATPQETCYHYNKDNPLIEVHSSVKGEISEYLPTDHVIMFIVKGQLKLSLNMYDESILEENTFFFHPGNVKSLMESLTDYTLIILRFRLNMDLCAQFPLQQLCDEAKQPEQKQLCALPVTELIQPYMDGLQKLFEDDNYCAYFHELKLKEFLFLLKISYSQEELQRLFHPILNKDLEFAAKIYSNLHKVKTVKDLIEIFNYSYSGFEKRFKKIFGVSAYKWLQNERAKAIYHEITCTTKTIVTIGYEFGFSSPSHFNDYCRRMFNDTPGNLRKTNRIKALL